MRGGCVGLSICRATLSQQVAPPRQKHKQQQHPRHHSPATDGTRPPLVRDGNTPARVVSAPAVTLRISEPSRLLSEFLSLSLARARAHTFSLSPLAVSLRWVSFFLFFPAQHTDCEDHPKVIQSCERVHRPTVRTSSRHPNNANNPNNDGNNSNSNNTPPFGPSTRGCVLYKKQSQHGTDIAVFWWPPSHGFRTNNLSESRCFRCCFWTGCLASAR